MNLCIDKKFLKRDNNELCENLEESNVNRFENSEEKEEGEVLGCDEDEEDMMDLEEAHNELVDRTERKLINIYRYKIAYELLPLANKLHNISKINKQLILKIAADSLKFIFTTVSITSVDPSMCVCEEISLPNLNEQLLYMFQCIKMVGNLIQWSYLDSFSEKPTEVNYHQLVQLVKTLFKESNGLNEGLHASKAKYHTGKTKRQFNQRKTEDLKVQILVFQTASLFWFAFLDIGVSYLKCMGRNFNSHSNRNIIYPLNLSTIFGCSSKVDLSSDFNKNVSVDLLSHLFQLWSLRDYTLSPYSYTLGNRDLNAIDNKIRPVFYFQSSVTNETIFESKLRFDFLLSGLNSTRRETNWAINFLQNYNSYLIVNQHIPCANLNIGFEYHFLNWIINVFFVSLNYGFNLESTEIKSDSFIEKWKCIILNLHHLYFQLINSDNTLMHPCEFCTFIPITKDNIVFIASKCLAYSLCAIAQHLASSVKTIEIACLVCVFCQVDGWSKRVYLGTCQWPSVYSSVANLIHDNWSIVRDKFSVWVSSCNFIFDSGLLSMLVQMEQEYNEKDPWSQHKCFIDECANRIQHKQIEPIDHILERFIHSESRSIISCFEAIRHLNT